MSKEKRWIEISELFFKTRKTNLTSVFINSHLPWIGLDFTGFWWSFACYMLLNICVGYKSHCVQVENHFCLCKAVPDFLWSPCCIICILSCCLRGSPNPQEHVFRGRDNITQEHSLPKPFQRPCRPWMAYMRLSEAYKSLWKDFLWQQIGRSDIIQGPRDWAVSLWQLTIWRPFHHQYTCIILYHPYKIVNCQVVICHIFRICHTLKINISIFCVVWFQFLCIYIL